jgi:hypothetical protein
VSAYCAEPDNKVCQKENIMQMRKCDSCGKIEPSASEWYKVSTQKIVENPNILVQYAEYDVCPGCLEKVRALFGKKD